MAPAHAGPSLMAGGRGGGGSGAALADRRDKLSWLRLLRQLRWGRLGSRLAALLPRRQPLLRVLAGRLEGLPEVLFEAAGAGMLAVDRAGRIVRANTMLQDMVGVGVDLSPGAPARLAFATPEREQVSDEIRHALAGRPPHPPFATRLEHARAGPEAAVSASVVSLRDAPARRGRGRRDGNGGGGGRSEGAVAGALLRLTDITLQRQLQAQLGQAQKLQAVGSLAGGIAHDFNNLLTAVLGAAEAIAGRGGLDAETLEDAAQIRASAGRGAALVRQLLAFGRQQTLQPQVLAVNEVIADLSGLLRRLLGSKIRLQMDLEEPGRRVRADPTQLDQVLVNLAVNARDAMPEGGSLTLQSGHLTVYRPLLGGVEVIPPGRYVMIEVRDTGSGIPAELLPRIFDPFFTTRREQGGNGLGLSTVHGIVRQSDGFLGVESEPGRGTSFRIYLPRFDGEPVTIPSLPEPETPRPSASMEAAVGGEAAAARAPTAGVAARGTVLLVDDEEPVRRLAERALARQGWQVMSAASGEAALELLGELPQGGLPRGGLAAIVSDVVMPGMDGATLVQAVRSRLDAPRLPALLVSGYAETSLRGALADSQRVSFLAKPYALKQLADRLAELVAADAG